MTWHLSDMMARDSWNLFFISRHRNQTVKTGMAGRPSGSWMGSAATVVNEKFCWKRTANSV